MIILSFDIGIKNLAYCQLDSLSNDILDWNVIDCTQNKNSVLAVIEQLEKIPNFIESDVILLEKQPSFNPIMRIIQTTIYVYFTLRYNYELNLKTKILYYSAKNKLKICNSDISSELLDSKSKSRTSKAKKRNYYLNKKAAIEEVKTLLKNNPFLNFFEKHKKKDDLADCYLQALAYIN